MINWAAVQYADTGDDLPGIGHNHPPPDEPEVIDPLDKPVFSTNQVIDMGVKASFAAQQRIEELTRPRKTTLRKYRRSHHAQLIQRQREYRYGKAVERLEQDTPWLTPTEYRRRQQRLREQHQRVQRGAWLLEPSG